MKNKFILTSRILALGLIIAMPCALAQSGVPGSLSYQGRVTDASGNPVGNPAAVNRAVIFRVWDSPTASGPANLLYSEQQVVTIDKGEFNVLVGQGLTVPGEEAKKVALDTVFDGAQRFLGVTVDDGTAAADLEITPRQQLVTSAFAFRAKTAEEVTPNAITSSMLATNAVTRNSIAPEAIDSSKLAPESIDSSKLAAGSIVGSKLAAGSVTSDHIATGAIDSFKLAAGAVTNAAIADNSISGSKLAAGSITSDKLAVGAASGFWSEQGGNVFRASGNVGIGTSNPLVKLHIVNTDTTSPSRGEYFRMTGAAMNNNLPGFPFDANHGIVFELGQNSPTGRHLWISDTARLRGAGMTRIRLGLMAETTAVHNFIDVCDDTGTGGFPLSLNPEGGGVGIGSFYAGTGGLGPVPALYVGGDGQFTGTVTASNISTFSDARIKSIVSRSKPGADLELVRKLQVTDYRMIDQKALGGRVQKGFIAQEVQKIVPEAVTELKHSFIPSINAPPKKATFDADSKTLHIVLEKAHGLKKGDMVQLKDDKRSWELNVSETSDATSFVAGPVEAPLSEIHVYGKKVDDFLSLDYNRLFTAGIGAIQELADQVEAVEAENAELRAKLAASEQRFSELEAADKTRRARLTAIEQMLSTSNGAVLTTAVKDQESGN